MAKAIQRITIFDGIDFPEYSFREYPKMLYTSNGETVEQVEVMAPSDEKALGKGYYATPKLAMENPVKAAPAVVMAEGEQTIEPGAKVATKASPDDVLKSTLTAKPPLKV